MTNYRVEGLNYQAAITTEIVNGVEVVVKVSPAITWAKGRTLAEVTRKARLKGLEVGLLVR